MAPNLSLLLVAFQVEEVFPVQPGVWHPCYGFNDLYVDTQQRTPRVHGPGPQHYSRTVHSKSHLLYLVYLCPGTYQEEGQASALRLCLAGTLLQLL